MLHANDSVGSIVPAQAVLLCKVRRSPRKRARRSTSTDVELTGFGRYVEPADEEVRPVERAVLPDWRRAALPRDARGAHEAVP